MNTSASTNRTSFWLALALALVASMVIALVRFHPVGWWNFAAVGALSLFVGARLRSWWALALPLGLMLATDLWLSLARPDYPFLHPDMPFGYGTYVVIFVLGYLFGQTENPLKLGGLALGGSLLFFLVSNFGAWLNVAVLHTIIPVPGFDDYTADLGGLLLCYDRGLPFFPGTLAGDLVFAAGLFGSYALVTRWVNQPRAQPEKVWS